MSNNKQAQLVSRLEADLCFAFSDSNRILILYALDKKPCNVTEISQELNLPQPSTSRHLKILRERGLVHAERKGTSNTYHLADRRLIKALDILRDVLRERLARRASLIDQIDKGEGPNE